MATINELIADAELLVNYALVHGVSLPAGCADTLLAAKGQAVLLSAPGKPRNDFNAAFGEATQAIGLSAAEIRSAQSRRSRMRSKLTDAHELLDFAAANAKKVEDETRTPLLTAGDAIERGTATIAQEQAFLKAYEGLTATTAPVTAESIRASKTNLPHILDFVKAATRGDAFRKLTLGRFFNVIFFGLALFVACSAMSFYALGNTALLRYDELGKNLAKLEAELPGKQDRLAILREALWRNAVNAMPRKAMTTGLNTTKDTLTLDELVKSYEDAMRPVTTDTQAIQEAREEQKFIANRLWKWSQLPCDDEPWLFLLRTICSQTDRVPEAAEVKGVDKVDKTKVLDYAPGSDVEKISIARTIASRLNDVYLPLLLGFLGAYAFILRTLATQIATSSLTQGSAIQHAIRLGTGALAGFASAWLLRPEMVGGESLKYVPSWALAFIAGYGIELVFSFMDRIVNTFADKKAATA